MNTIFLLISVQALMGAFDNLWHHELQARLPQRPSARYELTLHAAREAIYGVLFIGLAWWQWQGALALLLAALLVAELFITLADFLEEDRSRTLPPFERVLHTLLTISYGLLLALVTPVLWAWWQWPTAWVFAPHGWASWLLTAYGVGVWAWSARNVAAVLALGRPIAAPLGDTRYQSRTASTVLVTGATGFVGQALVQDLLDNGYRVIAMARDLRQARLQWKEWGEQLWVVDDLAAIPNEARIHAVVHLAGARVLGIPWTRARRKLLISSRVETTAALGQLMRRLEQRPDVLVSASAVGYYGVCEASLVCTEASPPKTGEFQSDLCVAIEHEPLRLGALGVRVVCLRFGVVLGPGGGAYPLQALASRFGLGAVLGSGQQAAPWVHLQDAVGLIRFAIRHQELSGPVNAVAPHEVNQTEFVQTLAASFGRRVWLGLPAWLLRCAAGEMSTLLLDGQQAVAHKALSAGYRFRHRSLSSALTTLAQRRAGRIPVTSHAS